MTIDRLIVHCELQFAVQYKHCLENQHLPLSYEHTRRNRNVTMLSYFTLGFTGDARWFGMQRKRIETSTG